MSAKWFRDTVPVSPPAEGDYDFQFDHAAGSATVFQLQSGIWVSVGTFTTNGSAPTGNAATLNGLTAAQIEAAVTAAMLGLGNVDNTHDNAKNVDKVGGQTLSQILDSALSASQGACVAKPGSWLNITNFLNGATGTVRYRLEGDIVRLCGSINMGSSPTVFMMPSGFRPTNFESFSTWSSGYLGYISLLPDGTVRYNSAYGASFDITFPIT